MDYEEAMQKLRSFKDKIRRKMVSEARSKNTVSYTDLFFDYGLSMKCRECNRAASEFLGDVSEEEHNAGRPLLSALVVHKGGDERPGSGFYGLASRLEKLLDDASEEEQIDFWREELEKVYEYHKAGA